MWPADPPERFRHLVDVAEASTAPPSPDDGDKWLDTSDDPWLLKRWNESESEWQTIGGGGGAVAVDDDGTEVVAEASRLNFGSGLSVTDDTGGQVTIDAAAGAGAHCETVGDNFETTFDIVHNLDSTCVVVSVAEVTSGEGLVHGTGFTWLILNANTVRVVFTTAPDSDDAEVTVLASGGTAASAPGGGLLAHVYTYALGEKTTTSSSSVDVDGSLMVVTFYAPASGQVLVSLTCYVDFESGSSGNTVFWNLREGTSDVPSTNGSVYRHHGVAFRGHRVTHRFVVSDLTPDTAYTYKWGWSVSGGTGRLFASTSALPGPAIMEVWAA